MLNLSNELIFTCANNDSAQIASKNIGEREVVEKSWGWTGGRRSTNYQRVIKPILATTTAGVSRNQPCSVPSRHCLREACWAAADIRIERIRDREERTID